MITRKLLAAACAATFASGAYAVSPYDLPYGLQWSFQAGDGGNESATDMDVTSDGIAHLIVRSSNTQTFGDGSTNSVNGDIGGVNARGQLIYGTTISSLPGLVSPSQNYPAGVHAGGDGKAYFGTYSNNNAHWNDPGSVQDPVNELGKQSNSPMVWSINSNNLAKTGQFDGNASLTTAIEDRNSLSIYEDNFGTLRSDTNAPTTTGLSVVGTQLRSTDSAFNKTTKEMIIVNDMVNGDFGTAGDYGGYNLRNDGTANAYLPGIGRYNFATNTLDGPAKQPILTYTGPESGWSNMGVYVDAGVDQATGWYFGGGIAQSRSESKSNGWDPDGSGPAPAVSFVDSIPANFADDHRTTSPGIGTAYDSNNNLMFAVTWDTAGYDIINSIAGFGDGSNNSIWAGERFDEVYFEVRDGSGNVLASITEDYNGATTDANRISEAAFIDGAIYVTGYAPGLSSTRETFVAKYDWDGTPGSESLTKVWERFIEGGSSETVSDGTLGKLKSYVYASTDGQWDNTTGYVNPGGSDILLQKVVPGDFSGDGIVDFAEVLTVDAATAVSSAVDTYDFDEDGDSDFMDVTFFYFDILDNLPGDTDGDGDIDDSDLGTSFSQYTGPTGIAGGRNALDGDADGDGDVDDSDLGTAFSGYTGPLGPGSVPEPTSLALIGLGGLALIRRRRA
ncbi:MAG: PEP-CTERM sorting domain-containing protein [Phycisphaeraceae bacterium]